MASSTAAGGVQLQPDVQTPERGPPIDLVRFCSLLQRHADGTVKGDGKNCVMFFGNTGAGKSTMLHLLAGAEFRSQAVQVEYELGPLTVSQLVTDTHIPGCDIGNSTASQTLLLNSYPDEATDLTYIDTPGFNNVGDSEGDDTTVDAANSAAIMAAIKSCKSLRIVFLINVKDELHTTRAGQIKKLLEVMYKFINDANSRMSSVLMLFTHCDGCPTHDLVSNELTRVYGSLPDTLKPLIRRAVTLLQEHGDNLLVNPAATYAKDRIKVVRGILSKMEPITDIEAALQCPLSEGVKRSLELACHDEKEKIRFGLKHNSLLSSLRGPLQHLRLLHDALGLPDVVWKYTSALEEIREHATTSTDMARQEMSVDRSAALDTQSFQKVRTLLTIFSCDLDILAEYMKKIGEENVLVVLKSKATCEINSTCERFFDDLDRALLCDDFDSAAKVLTRCEGLLEHLKEHLLAENMWKATHGTIEKVRVRMNSNAEEARTLISDKSFESKLNSLLNVIRKSSEHTLLMQYVKTYSYGSLGRSPESITDSAEPKKQAAQVQKIDQSSKVKTESTSNVLAAGEAAVKEEDTAKDEKGNNLKRPASEASPEYARKSRRGANDEGAGDRGRKGESASTTEPAIGKRTRSSHALAPECLPAGGGTKEDSEEGRGPKSRRVVKDSPEAANADTVALGVAAPSTEPVSTATSGLAVALATSGSDYMNLLALLNAQVIGIADGLTLSFRSLKDAKYAFLENALSTADALTKMHDVQNFLGEHLDQCAKNQCVECLNLFSVLTNQIFEELQEAITSRTWENAAHPFRCLKSAQKLGLDLERRGVETRLLDMQKTASMNLGALVSSLDNALAQDDFLRFVVDGSSLGNATRLLADSVLGEAALTRFNTEYKRLFSIVAEKFKQTVSQCANGLQQNQYAETLASITLLEKMALASIGTKTNGMCAVSDFESCVAELLKHMKTFAEEECIECKRKVAQLDVSVGHPTPSDVAELLVCLQHAKQHKNLFFELQGKIPGLCKVSNRIQCELSPGLESSAKVAEDTRESQWDLLLFQKYQTVEDELRNSLLLYAVACQERCISSLAIEPKPHADDVAAFLKTLDTCKQLQHLFATGQEDFQPFTKQHTAVVEAIKRMFKCLHKTYGSDIIRNKMAEANVNLDKAKEMLVLRDVFAADAFTLDAAVEGMRTAFDQKCSQFSKSVCDALRLERFTELNTLLLGHRDLTGAAEQDEYNDALSRFKEAGQHKHATAMRIISYIGTSVQVELPASSMEQVATALKWIEGAKCLGESESPVLPDDYAEWKSASYNMTSKLERLKAKVSNLDEWKFKTAETMYRRLENLLMLCFPTEIAKKINTMREELCTALEAKAAGLNDDMRKALDEKDYQKIDLIFNEVTKATDADSTFVQEVHCFTLNTVLENFLDTLIASIKNHYEKFEIKEAELKKIDLANLAKKSKFASNHIAHLKDDLEALAISKKKTMISKDWLKAGDIRKVDGFRQEDRLQYDSLVDAFIESFDHDIQRLQRVETQDDVFKVDKIVNQLPLFAVILGSEKTDAFQKFWDDIWNSFFRSTKSRLTFAASGPEQLDINGSISFLQAARDIFSRGLNPVAPTDATQDPQCTFSLPFPDTKVKELITKLDSLLSHLHVNTSEIDASWKRYIDEFDCTKEGQSYGDTLRFISQLKRQATAIRACDEYGIQNKFPTADRAIQKLCQTASSQIAALDSLKPEDGVTVWHNLEQIFGAGRTIIDDDALQDVLLQVMSKPKSDAQKWVAKMEHDIAEKSAKFYGDARNQDCQAQRKSALLEVTSCMESHERLQMKLVQLKMRPNTGAELPLVTQLKTNISKETDQTIQRLSEQCNVEEIAESIHGTYITATELVNETVSAHAESCIGKVLDAVEKQKRKNKFGLQDLGAELEARHDVGGQIVLIMPQFVDMNLLAFQEMTTGKTPQSTVDEVSRLNKLPEAQKVELHKVVKQVFAKYEAILKKIKFHFDLDLIVADVKKHHTQGSNLPDTIGGVFAIWSLLSKTERGPTLRRPLSAQVVAIVRLLNLDKPRENSRSQKVFSVLQSWLLSKKPDKTLINASHLAQIKTGQGKSVVLGVLATVLSMVGFNVDCVCYSAYLSERDHHEFEAVFTLFGVSHMVTYGTFQQLSERLVNSEGDVRALTHDVFKNGGTGAAIGGGAAAKASGSAAGQSQKKSKKQSATGQNRILLVDEVDVLLTPSFYGETYDAEVLIQLHNIADLQKLAWKMKMEGGDLKLILPALKVAEAYDELLRDHAGVKNILNAQIAKMCSDLEAWVNGGRDESFRDYQIIDGKVAYKKGVAYDSKISLGYVTLWAYFSEVESKRIPDATLEEHLGLRINCGQFSYAEIPKRYELILGVTGTLVPEMPGGPEPLGCFEQDIIREDYKIVGKTELPSVFGQRNLTFRENEHVSVHTGEDDFNNVIELEVAKAKEGRAYLVFFESEARLQEWKDSDYGKRIPAGIIDSIKSDTLNINLKVRKATRSGNITLLSREHGRGLDFHCTDKTVEDLGGIHVIQTFLSEEFSEEIQIRGRTARQKNKGTFQMILLAKDLEKFGITAQEIELKQQGIFVPVISVESECTICLGGLHDLRTLPCGHGFCRKCIENWLKTHRDCPLCRASASAAPAASAAVSLTPQSMYKFLHAKRAVFLDKSSRTRQKQAECAKLMHDQTIRFQEDLVALAKNPQLEDKKQKCLKFLGSRNAVQAKCRLMCLSDATGSMASLWEQTQNSILKMLQRISEISGGSGNIEIKWVAFRDYELDRSKVLEVSNWTDDPTSLVRFVGGIKCLSAPGCDGPEAVEAALNIVNTELEPPTRVVLIGDAPPHYEGKGNSLKKLKVHTSNYASGAFVAGGKLLTDYRKECADLKCKNIKVYPFYLNQRAKATFDEIAEITEGTSKSLDSTDADSLIHAICETALEDIGGVDMKEKYRVQYRG